MKKIYMYDLSNQDLKALKTVIENSITINCLKMSQKYHCFDDYVRSLIGWYVLQISLKKDFEIDISTKQIYVNEYGKPYIDDAFFNLSHSCNLVMVMIDTKEEVGIDIEYINTQNDHRKLASRILENDINDPEIETVYKKWTKIEAVYKKQGTGIIYNKLDIDTTSTYSGILFDKVMNKYVYSYYTHELDELDINYIINIEVK